MSSLQETDNLLKRHLYNLGGTYYREFYGGVGYRSCLQSITGLKAT